MAEGSVTMDRWQLAQLAERQFHNESFEAGREHYRQSYEQYFKWLGIDKDLAGKNVVEIGPADFPALAYCENLGPKSLIIEPMPSEHLKRFGIKILSQFAEAAIYQADEVWLFNVLQHVIDPYMIVARAKLQAKTIRFFEPIDYGINDCHPWNLTEQMFKDWFGAVSIYPFNENAVNFHSWKCAYGVWNA